MAPSLWSCAVLLAAMLLSAFLTWLVRLWVVAANMRQTVRDDGPQSHLKKTGTPTLGGLGMLGALAVVVAILRLTHRVPLTPAVWLILGLALAYGAIGFADDFSKLRFKRPLGLKARERVPLECLLALLFAWGLNHFVVGTDPAAAAAQLLPWGHGLLWFIVVMFVAVGGSNAVNLTDGLDGLAAGVTCFCALGLAGACWLLGRPDLALLSMALAGVCAGFLWHNAHPATIFMGDVGSLGLGAALAGIAVAAKLELLLGLFGLIFVLEALSVIIQVLYFKFSGGRRVFRMAPFHHHLELCGWAETKIVTRFWLTTLALAALGVGVVVLLVARAAA
jgi:phospho-N-acetylmuramoyl-pentapeptide-transferase